MRFRRNATNPIDADVIIVDEGSFLDLSLSYNLFKAIPSGSKVILIGDRDQLPPVGAGEVFADLIDSGVVPVARLTSLHRQKKGSGIAPAAHRINTGNHPMPKAEREAMRDGGAVKFADGCFQMIEQDDPERVLAEILDLVTRRIPADGHDPRCDIQVMAPMHKGILGTENLNRLIKERLNPVRPGEPVFAMRDRLIGPRDRVIQSRNDYNLEVFNGDVGSVVEIEATHKGAVEALLVEFPDLHGPRIVRYKREQARDLWLANAITFHKSQGSEFPVVVMPCSMQHYIMLQRPLFYTGVSRGRQASVVVGSDKAMMTAVRTVVANQRFTHLSERVRSLWELQPEYAHYPAPHAA
jgi:exodeoxyribonuclease V alpha subunit